MPDLKTIVQQMVDAGESESAIAEYIRAVEPPDPSVPHMSADPNPHGPTPSWLGTLADNARADISGMVDAGRRMVTDLPGTVRDALAGKQAWQEQMGTAAEKVRAEGGAAQVHPVQGAIDRLSQVPGILYNHPVNSALEVATLAGSPDVRAGVANVAPTVAKVAATAGDVVTKVATNPVVDAAVGAYSGYQYGGVPGAVIGAVAGPTTGSLASRMLATMRKPVEAPPAAPVAPPDPFRMVRPDGTIAKSVGEAPAAFPGAVSQGLAEASAPAQRALTGRNIQPAEDLYQSLPIGGDRSLPETGVGGFSDLMQQNLAKRGQLPRANAGGALSEGSGPTPSLNDAVIKALDEMRNTPRPGAQPDAIQLAPSHPSGGGFTVPPATGTTQAAKTVVASAQAKAAPGASTPARPATPATPAATGGDFPGLTEELIARMQPDFTKDVVRWPQRPGILRADESIPGLTSELINQIKPGGSITAQMEEAARALRQRSHIASGQRTRPPKKTS